jgi:hypothetical protein
MLLRVLSSFALASSFAVEAQVYRCAGAPVYTDKPCERPALVDLRGNILGAGPAGPAPAEHPTPAIVMPDRRTAPGPAGGSTSVWDSQAAREAHHRARTAPYTPPR